MFEFAPIVRALLRQKSRSLLIILQVSLTLAIVSNALSIVDDKKQKLERKSGVNEEQVLSVRVFHFSNKINFRQQFRLDQDMLRSKPEVNNASITTTIPYGRTSTSLGYSNVLPSESNATSRGWEVGMFSVSEDFIDTMEIKLVAGRNFTPEEITYGGDPFKPLPVIVTQAFASKMFPDGDALGRKIFRFEGEGDTIIGIIDSLQNPYHYRPEMHELSVLQPNIPLRTGITYVLNVDQENMDEVRDKLGDWFHEGLEERVVQDINTIAQMRGYAYFDDVGMIRLLQTVMIVLLMLTGLAVVGTTSFSVNQRTKQIGTRRALGATKLAVVRYFLVENFALGSVGIIVGCILALILNIQLMKNFDVGQLTSGFVVVTMSALFILGIFAVIFPALKAARVSPAMATRSV